MRLQVLAAITLLLAAPAQALPSAPSPAMEDLAADAFGDAVQAAYLQAGEPAGTPIPQAIEAGAYHSALALIAERLAQAEEARLWEDAQSHADPQEAYIFSVFEAAKSAEDSLEGNLSRLRDATEPRTPTATAARLFAAAELLVQAESDVALAAGYLAATYEREQLEQPHQRVTVLAPALKSRLHSEAAAAILDDLPAGGSGSVDSSRLAALIAERGGVGNKWREDSHGAFHDLARHVRIYGQTRPNATVADLEQSVLRIDARFGSLPADDPAALALASARLDGAWWVQRAEQEEVTVWWEPTINFLNGRSEAAMYGQALLQEARDDGVPWVRWAWVGGAAAAAAIGVVLWGRGRRRGRGRATSALLLVTVSLVCAFAPVAAHGTGADHAGNDPESQAPVLPLPEDPVPYTRPTIGGHGNIARAPDGTLHFVWVGCAAAENGCRDVYHRSLGPDGTWSESRLVVNPMLNASLPRVAVAGGEVHVTWLEGTGSVQGQTKELWHCLLRALACEPATRLSPAGRLTAYYDLDAAGGHAVVAWSQEDTQSGMVFSRWWRDGKWAATVPLSDQTHLARYPDVAVDPDGEAHVAWQAGAAGVQQVGGGALRTVEYGRIGPAGILEPPTVLVPGPVNDRVRPVVAIQESGTVGVAYNPVRDLMLIERAAGGQWSSPVNVSRLQRTLSFPALDANGDDWVVSWTTGALGTFHLWQALREEGFWLRPQIVVSEAPYDELMVNPDILVAGGRIHTAWTAAPQGLQSIEMLYCAWSLDERPAEPPAISLVSPRKDGWTRGPTVELKAMASADAVLDPAGTRWEVDGAALPTTVGADGSVTAKADLADGLHAARVVVADEAGNTAEAQVPFTVDSALPTFRQQVFAGGAEVPGDAWYRQPVEVRVSDVQDSTDVEMQYDLGGRGHWLAMEGDKVALPEGMHGIRLRAVDEAGNVALGPVLPVGWDAQEPQIALEVPRWAKGPVLSIPVNGADTGSPVTVTFTAEDLTVEQPLPGPLDVGIPDGNHRLSARAADAAGNAKDLGAWDLGVDSQPPKVAAVAGVLRVEDPGVSGLANLTAEASGDPVLFAFDGDAQRTFTAADLGPGPLQLVVSDRAGNQWRGTVDLVANLVEEETVFEAQDKDSEPVPGPAGNTGIPAPPVGLLLAVLALAGLARRASRPKGP